MATLGQTPLHRAAQEGHLAVVDVVTSIYPDPESWHLFLMGCGSPAMLTAYLAPPGERVASCLPHIYVDRVMALIWSFLRKPRYVSDLDEVDSQGHTALQLADGGGHSDVVALLRKNGAA